MEKMRDITEEIKNGITEVVEEFMKTNDIGLAFEHLKKKVPSQVYTGVFEAFLRNTPKL